MNTSVAASLLAACLTATAAAQTTGPGLSWAGPLGGSTGAFQPSCTVLPVGVFQGEAVTLRVWGDPGSPFVLGAALATIPCLPIGGIGNGLLLNPPLFVVASGTLTQTTPCLSCPPGLEPVPFTMPSTVPVGTQVSFQALGVGNNTLSLTVAITAIVQ